MKELGFSNGSVVEPPEIQLACTRCREFQEYNRESDTVVRCGECGKRHSNESLWDVNAAGIDR